MGALPLGTAEYTIPAGSIYVSPTGNNTTGTGAVGAPYATLAKALTVAVANDTIVMRAGTYTEGGTTNYSLGLQLAETTHNGLTIQNYPGEAVWLDGSVVTTGWLEDNTRWRLDGWTRRFPYDLSYRQGDDTGDADLGDGFVRADYPCAHMPDQVFIDGVSQQQVGSLAEVGAGEFFLDLATSKLYIGSNPTGKEVRVGNYNRAITMLCLGGTIRGIGIRRYSNPIPDQGALLVARTGNTIENVFIEDCATTGLAVSVGTRTGGNTIRNCTIRRNGMMGLAISTADDTVVEGCLITGNNSEHFDAAPASGGIKCTRTHRPIFRRNTISDNVDCSGLWLDECVYDFQILSNDLQGNTYSGLNLEISAKGIVADNLITGNGRTQFLIVGTDGVRAWNNVIAENDFEGSVIMQDNRTPSNTTYAKDSRQPASFYTSLMTWQIVSGQWCNNVVGKSRYAPWRVKQYNYSVNPTQPSKGWAAFGITADGNLFNRYTTATRAQPGTLVTAWGSGVPGTEAYYSTLALWRTGSTSAGRSADANSVEISGSDALEADFTLTSAALTATAGAGRPLPADIAALIGRPAGSTDIGVWR